MVAVSVILGMHLGRRFPDGVFRWPGPAPVSERNGDLLVLELGERIFNCEDSELVRAGTREQFARWFSEQRKMLALDWLHVVRCAIREIVRLHRHAARDNPDTRTWDELRLAFQFLLFEFICIALYYVTWVRGPVAVGYLVGRFLDAAGVLRKLAEGNTASRATAVEIVKL